MYIIDSGDIRSKRIADLVRQLGFMNVYPVEGGMDYVIVRLAQYQQYFVSLKVPTV